MASVVKAIPEMDATIPVLIVVGLESGEHSQLDPRGVSVFLHGSNDFDGDCLVAFPVPGLDDLAKCALAK